MALTESQRIELYEFVKQSSLGKAGADIVMNAIPTIDWNDLATRDDLALLRSELRGEMGELRSELRGEIGELRSELRSEMTGLRGDFQLEMMQLENRLQRSIVTWILAAQGLTLAAISVLVTTLAFVLS
ncbi:MAG: hypothetical protein CL424_05135 [Acidimicrobiaceae bacterium]|nr:hypothetical protein [Acidimicrobiaceae bacterium]